MGEWLSYRLNDFLMFTPEVYFRLFERYNGALWPGQWLAVGLALWFIVATRDGGARRSRGLGLLLGAGWLLVAWAFLWRYYAEVFLAAPYLAAAFALQGLLLGAAAFLGRLRFVWRGGMAGRLGLALLLYAVLVHPLVGLLAGREWSGVELFLLAPDPTAIGSLGLLLMIPGRPHWGLALVPLAWCVGSGVTYWLLGYGAGLATPAAALVASVAMAHRGLAARRGCG
jgi:hypothetical protein